MLEGFSVIFLSILLEAMPFVMIGAIASSLIELYITPEWLAARIPKNRWVAFGIAGLMGMVFPVCECAIVPIMRRLIKKGTPVGLAITFMLAVPIVNPVVLMSTFYAFPDSNMFILRGVFGFIGAVLVGLTFHHLVKEDVLLKDSQTVIKSACGCGVDHAVADGSKHLVMHKGQYTLALQGASQTSVRLSSVPMHQLKRLPIKRALEEGQEDACGCGIAHNHPVNNSKRGLGLEDFKRVLAHTSSELYDVGRFLIAGAFISSAMQVFVPRAVLMSIGNSPLSSILLMMVMAFVLSLCSEADAFIASTFRYQFSSSSLLAFLIFGPMIDIKNTLMLAGAFKSKFVIRLVGTITIVCFGLALAAQFIFA
jgi:hypothetical protein